MKTAILILIIIIIVSFPFLFNFVVSLKHKKQNMHNNLDNKVQSSQNKINKNFLVVLSLVLIMLCGLFYWFQIRPAQIRKECMISAQQGILSSQRINELYSNCVKANGLEK